MLQWFHSKETERMMMNKQQNKDNRDFYMQRGMEYVARWNNGNGRFIDHDRAKRDLRMALIFHFS
jgi:hypothetical protein